VRSATETSPAPPAARRPRRALVFAAGDTTAAELCARLTRAGYEAQALPSERATRAVRELAPDVALIELRAEAHAPDELDGLALVAALRTDPLAHALPLVLLFHTDDDAQRRAAQTLGADDYFAFNTTDAELRARLDALVWRNEAARRASALDAAAVGAEIDDFMRLFEAVRASVQAGAHGALALVAYAPAAAHDADQTEQTLAAAYEFFKLNLRRLDAVAFYGPDLLVIYLPRKGPGTAGSTLAQLRNEFVAAHPTRRLLLSLATFPADGRDVETLIERAANALAAAGGGARVQIADAPHTAHAPHDTSEPPQPASHVNAPGAAHGGLERRRARALRESRTPDMFEASVMPPASVRYGASEALAQDALAAAARERERRARGVPMPRRLLLAVSDAARTAQLNLLLRSAGYEVRSASDAQQALNLLRIDRPDLLVLDFEMRDLDGLEVMRRLGQQQQGAGVLPVVLLLRDMFGREALRAEAQGLGARGFVPVPYAPEELLDAVREAFGRDEKE
jgi:DNA-binding response OmpR family regulator